LKVALGTRGRSFERHINAEGLGSLIYIARAIAVTNLSTRAGEEEKQRERVSKSVSWGGRRGNEKKALRTGRERDYCQ